MRARDVVGRKIVAVRQHRFYCRHVGGMVTSVDAFVLDDGRFIALVPQETEGDLYVEAVVGNTDDETRKSGT